MEERQETIELGEAILHWMTNYKRHSVKSATYDRLVTSHVQLVRHPISKIDIGDLTSSDIQAYVNALVAEGYSLSTIRKQFNLITSFIRWANAEGIMPRPIYTSVKLPSQFAVHKPPKQVMAYTEDEQQALKHVMLGGSNSAYSAAMLMMETGLRVGEALALSWDDVDWRRKAIRVNKTLVRLANRKTLYVQQGAKSYTSNRTIPLSGRACEILMDVRAHHPSKSGYVFENDKGDPLSYEAMRYHVRRACEQAGVPYLGQHVFRHTFATNCFHNGCNVKLLSKLLGHADTAITYNTYIHLYGDGLEEMRSVLG